jgi:hypothetical protein
MAFQASEKSASREVICEPNEFLFAIPDISKRVDPETLDAVFHEQMIRLPKSIDGNDKYVE